MDSLIRSHILPSLLGGAGFNGMRTPIDNHTPNKNHQNLQIYKSMKNLISRIEVSEFQIKSYFNVTNNQNKDLIVFLNNTSFVLQILMMMRL